MNCAAVPRCIPAGTMPPSPVRPSRLRIPCSQGTRRAIESENDSLHPFSQGLAAATGIDFAPTPGGQFTKIAQLNSDPWSLLMRLGAPRRPTTRDKVFRKSAHVRGPDACNTRHSRVYLVDVHTPKANVQYTTLVDRSTNNVVVILSFGVRQRKLLRSAATHALANSASLVE